MLNFFLVARKILIWFGQLTNSDCSLRLALCINFLSRRFHEFFLYLKGFLSLLAAFLTNAAFLSRIFFIAPGCRGFLLFLFRVLPNNECLKPLKQQLMFTRNEASEFQRESSTILCFQSFKKLHLQR